MIKVQQCQVSTNLIQSLCPPVLHLQVFIRKGNTLLPLSGLVLGTLHSQKATARRSVAKAWHVVQRTISI